MKKILAILTGLMLLASTALAEKGPGDKQSLAKTTNLRHYTYFTINNITSMYMNTIEGAVDFSVGQSSGFEFPKGSGKYAIYEDGFVLGGYFRSTNLPPRRTIWGSTHQSGFQEGGIVTPGNGRDDAASGGNAVAQNPGDADVRVFRVRPDINPHDPNATRAQLEAKLQSDEVPLVERYQPFTAAMLYDNYARDWNEWPATKGAPYKDVNGDGHYDPAVDIPGISGADQTLWHLSNDMSTAGMNNFAGGLPVGIEIQRTIWGYNRQGALGNCVFMRYRIINKSGAPLDTMYAMVWSDPDLGYAGDDLSGCDTTRSLEFTYNGKGYDQTYGTACPACGYTFFQGPIYSNPGTTGIFDLQYRPDTKNMKMTAFNIFINGGGALYGDVGFGNSATIRNFWWHLLTGTVGSTGEPWSDPWGNTTRFILAGDPVTGAGWLDGTFAGPGDRRMCMSSGPFFMQPGDTQEVVAVALVGQGADRLSSVTAIREVSDEAQRAYNLLFDLPKPIDAPPLVATPIDGGVVLSWGDPSYILKAEVNYESRGYHFEGYRVYQTPKTAFKDEQLIRTFDRTDTPVLEGTGIERKMIITNDAIKSKAMINGTQYFFGVSALAYNPVGQPTILEGAPIMIPVIPQTPNPGDRFPAAGDTVKPVTQSGLTSDGVCAPIVVSPPAMLAHNYEVTFRDSTPAGGTQTTYWSMTDKTLNKKVVTDWPYQSRSGPFPIVDGLEMRVTGPLPGMQGWTIAGTRRFSPVGGYTGVGLEGFYSSTEPTGQNTATGTIGMAGNWGFGAMKTTLTVSQYHNVELRLAAVDNVALWNPTVTPSDVNFSKSYRVLRSVAVGGSAADPSFAPWIINRGSGYPYQDYNYAVPFSAWDLETNPPTRLSVGNFENNVVGGMIDGRWWPPLTDVTQSNPREFAFIWSTPYSETPNPALQINLSGATTPMMWVLACSRRAEASWAAGDKFTIIAGHVNLPGTVFSFKPSVLQGDLELAKDDVERINVYPNPYFAFNALEQNRFERFVTFTHLPVNATLRIIDVSGTLIRTLRKSDSSQFMRWDLKNEDGLPAGSGVYIVYVDMPDVGKTKTIKVAIVQPQQILEHY